MNNSLRDPISYVFEKKSIFDVASESTFATVNLLYVSKFRDGVATYPKKCMFQSSILQ